MEDEQTQSTQPLKQSSSRFWKYAFLILMSVVVVFALIAVFLISRVSADQSGVSGATVATDRPSIGDPSAPIVIVEYVDFQCQFCARALAPLKEVVQKYQQYVRWEFRHFPLYAIHPRAVPAGVASECANDQGKFWEFHDALFAGGVQALDDKDFLRHARSVGLDVGIFWDCFVSQKHLATINADYESGIKKGVRSTPTFFVNGGKAEGVLSIENWDAIFSQLLLQL